MKLFLAGLLCFSGFCQCRAAAKERPASGIISDLQGKVSWSQKGRAAPDLLDEVRPGDGLLVPEGGKLVIVYYEGCRKETITGKTRVKAGKTASSVDRKAAVQAQQAPCAGARSALPGPAGSMPQALTLMGGPRKEQKKAEPDADFAAEVRAAPKDPAAMISYAAYLENHGQVSEALAQYEAALRLRPESGALKNRCAELRRMEKEAGE